MISTPGEGVSRRTPAIETDTPVNTMRQAIGILLGPIMESVFDRLEGRIPPQRHIDLASRHLECISQSLPLLKRDGSLSGKILHAALSGIIKTSAPHIFPMDTTESVADVMPDFSMLDYFRPEALLRQRFLDSNRDFQIVELLGLEIPVRV